MATTQRRDSRYVSVCDGIGAVHAAWQPLGLECAWTSEIEAFPAAVVEQRWGFTNRGDMTKYEEWPEDEAVDILVGGTPCQSFSVAGLRKGLRDPRGELMLTFLEIARRYRPRWVVWENVPGVLSSNGGRDFGSFLGALGELGYGWAYRVLDAQGFGVAQRRRRVFVVGSLGDQRRAAAVLFERESLRRDSPPRRSTGQGTAGGAAPRAGGSGRGVGARIVAQDVAGTLACNTGPNGNDAGNFCSNQGVDAGYIVAVNIEHALGANGGSNAASVKLRDVAEPLTRSEHKGHTLVLDAFAFSNRTRDGVKLPEIMPGGLAPALTNSGDGGRSDAINVCVPIQEVGKRTGPSSTGDVRAGIGIGQKSGLGIVEELSPTLKARSSNSVAVTTDLHTVALREGAHGITELDAVPTLQAQGGGKPEQGYGAARSAMCVRRITPRECERLQGFPDDYTEIMFRGKLAADGPRYKALGNSMAVPVMRWIGARIIANSER